MDGCAVPTASKLQKYSTFRAKTDKELVLHLGPYKNVQI